MSDAGANIGASAPAAGFCRHCGRALTPETLHEVRGAYYCPDCLASAVGQSPATEQPVDADRASSRARAAAALGIVPGLGAVYNGDYWKALVHVLVFAAIITLIQHSPIFAFVLVAWIFYMPVEAYQTAKARALSGASTGPADPAARSREMLGPVLLIVIGTLALLNELNLIDIERITEFWPLGLIALGVWMLVKRQEQA